MGLHAKLDMQYNALLRVECVRVSYDNLERQIVVIVHLQKQEGTLRTNALHGYCAWLCKTT